MHDLDNPGRREFLGTVGGLSIATLIAQGLFAADEHQGDMIYRKLGPAGERVSAIGLGGYHIGIPREEQESIRLIRSAIDRGITFLDNSWDYMDGKCEVLMGKALRDGYRQKVFLMTKFDGRTKAATARQIDESLQRLQTDHVDLMQYHEVIRMEDPDRFFNDGPVEALLEGKKAGKFRYVGFTGHKDPYIHLRMLEAAQAHKFHFDTAQMPLNILDAQFRSFAHQVVPKLVDQGIAVLGMKPMAAGSIPRQQPRDRHRVPALCAQPAHLRGDHRLQRSKNTRPGVRSRAHLQAAHPERAFGAAGQDARSGALRQVRDFQNHRAGRRNVAQSAVDGVETAVLPPVGRPSCRRWA